MFYQLNENLYINVNLIVEIEYNPSIKTIKFVYVNGRFLSLRVSSDVNAQAIIADIRKLSH